MKKNIIYSILLLSLLFAGCKESFIEKEPPLYIAEEPAFSTPERIEATLLGLYGTFKSGAFMGGKTYVVFDNRGDDIVNVDPNLTTLADTYLMNVGTNYSENENAWYYAYLTINRCNVFIESLTTYNASNIVGEALCKQYEAEAKFVRSLCYYYLCQLYSQPYVLNKDAKAVPLRLVGIKEAGHSDCPRATISQIYTQILSDLSSESVNALPSGGNTYDSVTRASKGAANMLKMRVYMAMENWSEAINAGEAVTGYELDDVTILFTAPYYTKESIFSMPFAETNTPNTQQGAVEYYNKDICLIDFENGIMSKEAYALSDDKRIHKYVDGDNLTKFNETTKLQWLPIFRYAETKLNLAECYAKSSQTKKAQDCLHDVRSRSIAEEDDVINVMNLTGNDLLEAIENEKRLEFIGEGLRGIEIIRKGQNFIKGSGVNAVNVTPKDNGYTWPIPESERTLNKQIND